jgi:membrane protease YdiL (CAAX protease family)
VVFIGVADEVLFRGYVMRRLCDWLGNARGLLLGRLLFGLSYVAPLASQNGFAFLADDLLTFAQAFVGALIFGAIYLRAKNIVPGSILQVPGNLYIARLATMFGV